MRNYTVDVFAICYNEEFMLPHFIKHYKEKFNANITVYDNYSTDRSKEIILENGCNYIEYGSDNQIRDDIYLQIKNECWKKSKADWVIIVDIDEFLEFDFDISEYTIINTKGYDMIGGPESRSGVYNALMSKHVMFRPDQFLQIGYTAGCHRCTPQAKKLQGSRKHALLLHRKFISEEYVYSKHKAYEERLSAVNKLYGWGVHYQGVTKENVAEQFKELRKKAILV